MLRNTEAIVTAIVKTPDGVGQFNQNGKIRDTNQYSIPFVLIGIRPADAKIISNGKLKMEQVQNRWQEPVQAKSAMHLFLATDMGPAFERDFSQEVFSPITKIGESWPVLVHHLTDPGQGYAVTVEERRQATGGGKNLYYSNFRIHAIRSAEAAKRLGERNSRRGGWLSFPPRYHSDFVHGSFRPKLECELGLFLFCQAEIYRQRFLGPLQTPES